MKNTLWYALQNSTEDDWGIGTYDKSEALAMLEEDDQYNLIAVINNDVCTEEIWK